MFQKYAKHVLRRRGRIARLWRRYFFPRDEADLLARTDKLIADLQAMARKRTS